MKKLLVVVSALFVSSVFVSCGNKATSEGAYPGYKMIDKELHFKSVVDNPNGKQVEVGDILTLNMVYSLNNDSVLFSSEDMGQPFQLRADTGRFNGDFMKVFMELKEGDSASVIVKADTFFLKTAGARQSPAFIDSTDVLYFSIGLTKIQTMEEVQAEQEALNSQSEAKEKEQLSAYLAENNITVEPTASGMYFIPLKKGTGKQAEAGKTVKVNYEGMLINGTYFDTSIEEVAKAQGLYDERRTYGPFEFALGARQVIAGWDEGIAMLKEGGKARLIIPSNLGYGANPRPGGVIQPYNTLIFDVELLEVIDAQ